MISKIKNWKIVKSVFIMAVLAVLFTSLIGIAGYMSINKMDSITQSMYDEDVQPLGIGAGIRGEFANMRIEVHKAIIKYDAKYNESIVKHNDKIQKYLESYSKLNLDENDKKLLDEFKSNYEIYLSVWKKSNEYMSTGTKMQDEDYTQMADAAAKGENALFELKEYYIQRSSELNILSNNIHKSTIGIFVVLLLVTIVIFSFISYIIIKIIQNSAKEMNENIKTLATGDFTVKLETDSKNEFGIMKTTLSKMVKDVSEMIKTVKDNSKSINSQAEGLSSIAVEMSESSENVTNAIQDVAQGTNSQSEDLVEMTNVLNSFGEQINEIVNSIENVETTSNSIGEMAKYSNDDMKSLMQSITSVSNSFKDLIDKVNKLGNNIDKINEITNLINNIAGQTNLLALNASIEAARAGEQGKGFAVVADEIRKLAEQSKASSQKIYILINNTKKDKETMMETTKTMNSELNNQMNVIDNTINSFKKIVNTLNEVNPRIKAISMSALDINSEKNSILQKIEQASAVSEEVSASSEQIVASAQELNASTEEVASTSERLSNMTKKMTEQVSKFKL